MSITLRFKQFKVKLPSTSPVQSVEVDDFDLKPGEKVWVQAPSGFGKTSLLRGIAGLSPTHGKLIAQDHQGIETDLTQHPVHQRNMGILFQDQLLFSHLNVMDNICIGLKLRPQFDKKKAYAQAMTCLDQLELQDRSKAFVSDLSGGERQRVALIRALIFLPQILLLDEPFRGLDAHSKSKMTAFLRQFLVEHPIPVICVSHDPETAFERFDFVLKPNTTGGTDSHVRKFAIYRS